MYSPYTFYPTPFTSIRCDPGEGGTRVWQHLYHYSSVPTRDSRIPWHGMEHKQTFRTTSFPSIPTEPDFLCVCLATHIPLSYNVAFGTRINLHDSYTRTIIINPLSSRLSTLPFHFLTVRYSLYHYRFGVGGLFLLKFLSPYLTL